MYLIIIVNFSMMKMNIGTSVLLVVKKKLIVENIIMEELPHVRLQKNVPFVLRLMEIKI